MGVDYLHPNNFRELFCLKFFNHWVYVLIVEMSDGMLKDLEARRSTLYIYYR